MLYIISHSQEDRTREDVYVAHGFAKNLRVIFIQRTVWNNLSRGEYFRHEYLDEFSAGEFHVSPH